MRHGLSPRQRFCTAILLGLFLFLNAVGLMYPERASAGIPVSVIGDLTLTTFKIKDEIIDNIKAAVLNAAAVAVSYVLKKVAYDSAVWLASGGQGQQPLAFSQGFGDYLKNVASDAVGQGIELLGDEAGFSLCKIPNIQVDLNIRESIRLGLDPTPADPTRKPECNFTEFVANWTSGDAWKSQFNSIGASMQQQFNEALRVDQSGLGYRLAAVERIREFVSEQEEGAEKEREEGDGFERSKTSISKDTKIPSQLIKEEFTDNTNSKKVQESEDQIYTAISSGEYRLLPGALGRFFLNTLAGTVLKNFQERGVLPFGICVGSYGGEHCNKATTAAVGNYAEGGVLGGRRAAEALFSDLLAVKTNVVDQYNILAQLNSCPEAPGLYNCRADEGLVQAAQAYANGTPVTVKEAMDKGWLKSSWKLLPPTREAENSLDAPVKCYDSAYCYANIKVLRQLRILPIGFEIAAEKSDPDQPWTLGDVVAGFDKCTPDTDSGGGATGSVVYDEEKNKFCHLIDPNWVIKVFPTRCNALSRGASLLSPDVPDRMEECTDLSSCVAYAPDGSCLNYAYCTREKNTWKFNADACAPQFKTCRSYRDDKGQQKAYLYRTLDTGFCSQDNVGCQAYSFSQNAAGEWESPAGPNARDYINNGAFFTSKITASCSPRSAGCSAFQLVNGATISATHYLKKAPDYLKCYDANPTTPEVEWPKTRADVSRMLPDAACRNYSAACIPDEVGCNWYTPVTSGGERIPGKFKPAEIVDNKIVWNDQCDQKCAGYASYREMPSNYSNGEPVAYLIPSAAAECRQEEVGCASFTNLSTTSGGLEQVEYFSYLRPCALPKQQPEKNFITYEGSAVGGYQLKVFTLVADADGSPKYSYRTPAEIADYQALCSETSYKAGAAHPDCRQFNDDAGNVYYRLLQKTIPVSNSCTPYRLNNTEMYPAPGLDEAACRIQKGFWDNGRCGLCFQGGEYKDGFCFYYGLPGGENNVAGASETCTAAVNSCRAYKGNAGNNIREVMNNRFEEATAAAALNGWGPATITVSSESTRVGEHSLGYVGSGQVVKQLTLSPGKSYDLTFWGKGSGQSVTLVLAGKEDVFNQEFGKVSLSDTWKSLHIGPVEFNAATTTALLIFRNDANGTTFLDNVRLVEVTEQIFLVKNSIKIDPICDSTPNDNLPGEALGCTEYKDPDQRSVFLTNFSYLCREGAVGCAPFIDTRNTPSETGPRAYNVELRGTSGTRAEITLNGQKYSCQIPVGRGSCYVNIAGVEAKDIIAVAGAQSFGRSTVYIPKDTPPNAPVYLVANKEATCNAADLGCQLAGAQVSTPAGVRFVTTTIKNDPALYQTALCQAEAVGCKAYAGNSGNLFFKDPEITGQKICVYRTDAEVNGAKSSGWFWKGTGVCSNNSSQFCQADKDCGSGNKCNNINNIPCYGDYRQFGNNYGLWSYGDVGKYQNYVGECPVEQDRCTEFVDHNDNDRQYYFIKNEKISAGDCSGEVSQKEGCALFDQTDTPNKYWSTAASYQASERANHRRVKPVGGSATAAADANIIIKVIRDRECGEWLQCRSSHRVWDEKNARWKTVCDDIGRCNRAPERPEENDITNCANWAEGDHDYAGQVLTPALYVQRDTGWKGMEYSGWAIPSLFPLEELTQVNIAKQNALPDWRLARRIGCGDTNCTNPATPQDSSCKEADKPCGFKGVGLCVNGFCLQNIDGTTKDLTKNSPGQTCRAYPERDSPFPNTPALLSAASQFANVKLCNETKDPTSDPGKSYACECSYTKVTYGDDAYIKYWDYERPNALDPNAVPGSGNKIPDGICQGGKNNGAACNDDATCQMDPKNPGTCQKKRREAKLLGWEGFCLESDVSRTLNAEQGRYPCLTWFPVDTIIGSQDVNNQHKEAGYEAPADKEGGEGGRLFCLEANTAGGSKDPKMKDMDKNSPNYNQYYKFPASHDYQAPDLYFGSGSSKNMGTNRYDGSPLDNFTNLNTYEGPFGAPHRTCNYGGTAVKYSAGQFARYRFPASRQEENLNQTEIEKIMFQVDTPRDEYDPRNSVTFEIWPNLLVKGKPQAVYLTGDPEGRVVVGNYLGRENEFILMYGHEKERYVNKDGGVCNQSSGVGRMATANFNGWCSDYGDDSQACDQLRGNIFTGPLGSRHNVRRELTGVGYRIRGDLAEMNEEGIWDPNFSNREICDDHAYHYLGDGDTFKARGGNWHAIRLRFHQTTRQFLGYDTAYCNTTANDEGYINYKVTFRLNQTCKRVADATIGYTGDQRVIPWTNRLWERGGYSIYDQDIPGLGRGGLGYGYNTIVSPFGSLGLNAPPQKQVLFTSTGLKEKPDACDPANNFLKECAYDEKLVRGRAVEGVDFLGYVPGAPYACTGGPGNGSCIKTDKNGVQTDVNTAKRTYQEAYDSFGRIFARHVKEYLFVPSARNYGRDPLVGLLVDKTENGDGERADRPRAPLVFPVGECDTEGRCLEDNRAPGMSVNNVAPGKDAVFNTASAKVVLKFFTLADADQMPLRQIKVFWGDGEITGPEQGGLYQNHRGYQRPVCRPVGAENHCIVNELQETACDTNADCGNGATCLLPKDPRTPVGKCIRPRDTGAKCVQDIDCEKVPACEPAETAKSFGRILDKTCINKYQWPDHVYFCNQNSTDQLGNPAFFPPESETARQFCSNFAYGCCIYQPKVVVKDNWGWCNGNCRPEGGCYQKPNEPISQCDSSLSGTKFGNRIILPAPVPKQ